MKRAVSLNNGGDTIVEVLIVLAVLSLAVGVSYATANKSLLAARQAQENSTASTIAQSQVESLRALAKNTDPASTSYIFSTGHPFCIPSGSGARKDFLAVNPSLSDYSKYPSECVFPDVDYHVAIFYCPSSGANAYCAASGNNYTDDTFVVTVTWNDVDGTSVDNAAGSGSNQDVVSLVYKLHKQS